MLVIDNLETQADYVRELTLESRFGGRLVYVVANQSAVARFRPLVEIGGSDTAAYGPDVLLTPQSSFIDKISGVQFRSAVAASPARIIAQLAEPGDILPASGTPFTGSLAASGAATPTRAAMELIGELDLSTSTQFSGIPTDFDSLKLVYMARSPNAYVADNNYLRFNGDVGGNYDYTFLRGNAAAASSGASVAQTEGRIGRVPGSLATADQFAVGEVLIPNYGLATVRKSWTAESSLVATAAAADMYNELLGGLWRSLAAIASITLVAQGGGAYTAGSRAWLYGLSGV